MAYLTELREHCAGHCGRRAVVELRNRYNENVGRFCRKCGDRRLRELQAREERGIA